MTPPPRCSSPTTVPPVRAAIAEAGRLFPGATAVVVYARQPLASTAAYLERHPALEQVRRLDQTTLDASGRVAVDGARYAADHGPHRRRAGHLHHADRVRGHRGDRRGP